ncbi:MAG: carboxypeptidase-like regulatory domain-containing protein [Planctomycetia bacterium]|nr:carboxypeptidase-like regulatory domain-containing protein [Planctomycetia bacterium]
MRTLSMLFCGLILFNLLILTGCSSKYPKDMPRIYSVSATVQYDDGKPLTNASITFLNNDTTFARWICVGTTDANGSAQLRTQGSFDGIPAGDYRVIISAILSEGIPYPGEPTSPESEKLYNEWKKNKEKRFSLIDNIYEDREKTPLTANVEKKSNRFVFKVGKELKTSIPTDNP